MGRTKERVESRKVFIFKMGRFFEENALPLKSGILVDDGGRRAYVETPTSSVLLERKGKRERVYMLWEEAAQPVDFTGDGEDLNDNSVYTIEDAALETAVHVERTDDEDKTAWMARAFFLMAAGVVLVSVLVLAATGTLPIVGDIF